MNILPARIAFYVLLPAVLGGGLAWGTRAVTAPDAGEAAASAAGMSFWTCPPAAAKNGRQTAASVKPVIVESRGC